MMAPDDTDEVLTVPEVAKLLRIGKNAVYDLVGQGLIPHWRLGKHIRFRKSAIVRSLASCGHSQDALKGQ